MTKLYIVATPIGNLADISERAKQILVEVDYIAAEDTRHTGRLLQHLGCGTPAFAYHQHNEAQASEQVIKKLQSGLSIALVTDAGTPTVSDPGFKLVQLAHKNNIPVVAIPGACASIAALSVSGFDAKQFQFIGFLPSTDSAREKALQVLMGTQPVLIFYEAPHRVVQTIEQMARLFGVERRVSISRELTKHFEQSVQCCLGEAVDALASGAIPVKGEFVLVLDSYQDTHTKDSIDPILAPLLAELPLKQAVKLAVSISGQAKNAVYERALELKQQS